MSFASPTTEQSRSLTQFAILSMSTFLLGMYFGRELPTGVDLVSLQTGLIGVLTFLGLSNLKPAAAKEAVIASSNDVERRLERHVPTAHFGRGRRTRNATRSLRASK